MNTTDTLVQKFIRFAGTGANGIWGNRIPIQEYPQGMINRIANMLQKVEDIRRYDEQASQLLIETICEFGEAVLAGQSNRYLYGYKIDFDTTKVLDAFITPLHQAVRDLGWNYNQLKDEKEKAEPNAEYCIELQLLVDITVGGVAYNLKLAASGIKKLNLLGIEYHGHFLENEI